ncbi:hypothetical protein [Nonomuraea helvata]|uniref:Uncharacterized protein n=1 Tax=Nonomuraea helvata TaxID=37484 RepID=A0ABV5S9R0_9ACTN
MVDHEFQQVVLARAFPIHDIQLSKVGLDYFDAWLEEETDYARILAGDSVDL